MSNKKTRKKAENRGRQAEFLAALLLRLKGFRVLDLRYKTHYGEIDLVARRGRLIVFVEVKWRRTIDTALQSIHQKSQSRIVNAAGFWMANNPQYFSCNQRFDVIALAPWRWPVHLKQAFDSPDLH